MKRMFRTRVTKRRSQYLTWLQTWYYYVMCMEMTVMITVRMLGCLFTWITWLHWNSFALTNPAEMWYNNIQVAMIRTEVLLAYMMESVLLHSSNPFVEISQFICMCAPINSKLDTITQLFPDTTLYNYYSSIIIITWLWNMKQSHNKFIRPCMLAL